MLFCSVVASVTDLWGAAIPAWIGAIGTVAASAVAVVALFKGQSAKSGVENLAQGLNTESGNAATEARDDAQGDDMLERIEALKEDIVNAPRVRWRLLTQSKHRYGLLNDSGAVAHVNAVKDISDGYRDALGVLVEVPTDISPGAMLPFSIERSLASPAVTAVEVSWTEGQNGRIRRSVFYV